MKPSKSLVMSLIATGSVNGSWVTVPDDLASKARSLARDRMVQEHETMPGKFRPTVLGVMSAKEIDEIPYD